MLMDKTTEMVAHMIGIFHTSVEEVRLREVYEKFKALKVGDPESQELVTVKVDFKAGYRLGEFSPNVKYKPPYVEEGASTPIFPLQIFSGFFIPSLWAGKLDFEVSQLHPTVFWGGGGSTKWTLDPPASVIVVTFQSNFLYDDDLLVQGDGSTVFTDPTELLENLQNYQTIAEAIAAPVAAEVLLPGETAGADAIDLHNKIGSVEASTITGVTATVLHGVEAMGFHVNGEEVEELDALDDVLPAYHQTDEEEGTQTAGQAATGEETTGDETVGDETSEDEYEWPDPFEGLDNDGATGEEFHIEAGHTVVTGGNSLVNEVSISTAWLDAPLISVMGDAVNLEVIAQVNVLVDKDCGASGKMPSAVLNGAGMTFTSSEAEEEEAETSTSGGGGLPSNWVVTRIEGDVINFNHIKQYNFQTDHDRAELTFTSTNTYIGMGDNTVYNQINLGELGFGYDLICIGGNMISANWISQTNVLIDNDNVTYSGGHKAAIGSGDNLLFNKASIKGIGKDTHEEMTTSMAGISEALDDKKEGFKDDPAYNPVFEGVDLLRVLYVEGDVTTINWIKQINVLGDSDQVHLAMDNLEEETGAKVNVTAGSNAVVNLASITEYGLDSTIQVGGEVYDDALLYQAELIDTDADPLGVNLEGLATEAVAFLTDGMLSPEAEVTEDSIMPTAPEDISTPDVMQTMLA